MDPTTFDLITKLFASRRVSRRQALMAGGAGLAATGVAVAGLGARAVAHPAPGAAAAPPADAAAVALTSPTRDGFVVLDAPASNATAVAAPMTTGAKPTTFLFLQSFETGSLVPKPGRPGRYTLTLKHGLGDTVYFSDRPAKVVGTVPTAQFLKALGFTPANPPNAALVGQRSPTHKDVVVVELFDPKYDACTNTLTYEVTLLADWHTLDETFQQTPDDEAHLPRQFTAAHLFIDDCPDAQVTCWTNGGDDYVGDLGVRGMCWYWGRLQCLLCDNGVKAECNAKFSGCHGQCVVHLQT